MQTKIINNQNLLDSQIDEVVTRVKCFILNNNNEFLLANCGGCFNLPGGHVEEGEELTTSVIRELEEETGIVFEENEIEKPFLEVKQYKPNHRNTGKNRLSKFYYYFIRTNKQPDVSNINLTEHEKENNFVIVKIKKEKFREKLVNEKENNETEIFRKIAEETLNAFDVLNENILKRR